MFSLADLGVTWEKAKLSSGIPVHFFIKKGSPITFFIVFPVGSGMDPVGKKGITHLLEHGIYKSQIGGVELSEKLESMGGIMNGHTSKEEIAFYTMIGSFEDFDRVVNLFATAFLDYRVSDEDFDTERNVVIQELQGHFGDPREMLEAILEDKAMFAGTPYEVPIAGTVEDLRAINGTDMKDALKNLLSFQPIIMVTGDFDSNAALSSLEKNLQIKKPEIVVRPKDLILSEPQNLTHRMDVDFVHASMGFRGCGAFGDDYLGLRFLSEALGGGAISTILMKKIRKELGLVYFIHASLESYIDGGAFMITFGTEKKNLKTVYKEIKGVMKRISETGLTKEELEFTKQHVLKPVRIRFERVLSTALFHANGELFNPGKYHTLEMYLQEIEKTSNKKLLEVAQKYLSPDKANYMAVGNVEISDLV